MNQFGELEFLRGEYKERWEALVRNEQATRKCIKCGKDFLSQSKSQRRCGVCNSRKSILRNELMKYCT
jgi:DNA-directed RNA polymerase subunit RPC12/RpoP